MGIDVNGLQLLLCAKGMGVEFDAMATIGRQGLLISKKQMKGIFKRNNLNVERVDDIFIQSKGFADVLFEVLGANEVCSFDNSGYENATEIADFNIPIAEEFKEKYSLVLDGGALEHVFNYPIALKNCMEMVAKGGHLISITPGNNFMGHGFYQFSPELLYRALSSENGFSVCKMFLYEDAENGVWHEVFDPFILGQRVTLINSKPTYIALIAKRIYSTEVFKEFPQQSDYDMIWRNSQSDNRSDVVCTWSEKMNEQESKAGQLEVKKSNIERQRYFSRRILRVIFKGLNFISRKFGFEIVRVIPPVSSISEYDEEFFKKIDPDQLYIDNQ